MVGKYFVSIESIRVTSVQDYSTTQTEDRLRRASGPVRFQFHYIYLDIQALVQYVYVAPFLLDFPVERDLHTIKNISKIASFVSNKEINI